MPRPVVLALLLCLGVTLGIAGALVAPKPGVQPAIEWLETPRSLQNFSLAIETGTFDNQSLLGHWTIVLFGFLHCPDICPTSLSQLAGLADQLAGQPAAPEVDFVFVSVDPGRDSVADISTYVRHFNPAVIGVTGTARQLAQFADPLGVAFKVSPGDDYSVAHSITFSLIDPQGNLRGRFRPGFDTASIVQFFTDPPA